MSIELDFKALGLYDKLNERIYDAMRRRYFRKNDPTYCPEAASCALCPEKYADTDIVQWAKDTLPLVYFFDETDIPSISFLSAIAIPLISVFYILGKAVKGTN